MGDLFEQHHPSLQVAGVAFDSPLDKVFDYYLPAGFAELLQVGQRVQAPFGRGNRPKIGFCVEIGGPQADRPLKFIRRVIDPRPLISGHLLELARWLSSYYCCPLGTVLAGMIPGAVKHQPKTKLSRRYRLTAAGKDALQSPSSGRLGTKQRAILDTLRKAADTGRTHLPRELLLQEAHSSSPSLHGLLQKGLVELVSPQEAQEPLSPIAQSPPAPLIDPNFRLSPEQIAALEKLDEVLGQPRFSVHLLHGVTGSGKTEIYIRCIRRVLAMNRQAMVLVPEIALTTQTVQRFAQRLPGVSVLHSGLTSSQRRSQWLAIASGQGQVVVGPRSAIFAPAANLGLIVVDEEHEPSYKQDTQPRYHGRDVAIKRAQMLNIPVILGSATPSLESLHNTRSLPHFSCIRLAQRVQDLPLPKIDLVDLREEYRARKGLHIFSRRLESHLRQTLDQGRQAILLLNRRGYAGFISCPACDYVLTCEHCDVALTYHRRTTAGTSGRALCHYCLSESRVPSACPTCGGRLVMLGVGTQRAEQELVHKFPQARFARVDSDTMTRHKYEQLLERFAGGELDILLGTQMIAKGLDFPRVHLVGILSADTSLAVPDFRSAERTFQLAAQVAGRAGRASPGATVILQTFNPGFPAIHFATTHDYDGFARTELTLRKSLGYPPFGRMARIILRSSSLTVLQRQASVAAEIISKAVAKAAKPLKIVGPLPPPIARISGQHRLHFILHATQAFIIQDLLSQIRSDLFKLPVQLAIDVDPVNLL